jgi:ZIP family zinc transporter
MEQYWHALTLAALPALGNYVVGLFAEFVPGVSRYLGQALQLAAGIVLAVVGVELMPRVITASPPWVIVLAFIGGALLAVSVDKALDLLSDCTGEHDDSQRPWMVYFAVATDFFNDGLMIGTATTISANLGLLLAVGQVSADAPKGFATIASFQDAEVPQARRLLISATFAIPVLAGATIGYWLIRGEPELPKLALLDFTAAVLTLTAVEHLMVQAHERRLNTTLHELILPAGFALVGCYRPTWTRRRLTTRPTRRSWRRPTCLQLRHYERPARTTLPSP